MGVTLRYDLFEMSQLFRDHRHTERRLVTVTGNNLEDCEQQMRKLRDELIFRNKPIKTARHGEDGSIVFEDNDEDYSCHFRLRNEDLRDK